MARPQFYGNGLLGNAAGLMADGFPGGPGTPVYSPNRRNPLQMDMTGWSNPGASPRPAFSRRMGGISASPGMPQNYMAAPAPAGGLPDPMTKAGIPALPGGGGGYPGLPVDPYAPGGGAPGSPGGGGPSPGPSPSPSPSPSTPPVNPNLGPNTWGNGYNPAWYPGGSPNAGNSPANNAPLQAGQTGWGWVGPNNYTPNFSPAAQAYIQNQLYQNNGGVPAPWIGQVDPNNYLQSIGQLSGVPFNPANWGG